MKKRLMILLLAGLLALGILPEAHAAAGYADVPENHWAAQDVLRATELGLFQGVGGGKFGLGRPISRAAFATALTRLFGWETVRPVTPSYTDVAPDSWYYTAVETLLANDAVAASSRTFRPNDELTRDEMASMLVRGLGYASLAGSAEAYSVPFIDVTVNRGFITVAYDLGIMGGTGTNLFEPDAFATREQAAAVLVRVHDQLSGSSTQLSSAGERRLITISTPIAQEGDEMPITPLEPLPELYATLRRMKNSGDDMSQTALRLMAGGVRTITDAGGNPVSGSELISAKEVQKLLEGKDVTTYYSGRSESAYFIYHPNAYQTAAVWYQSDESMAAKLQLARLFGVTNYVLE